LAPDTNLPCARDCRGAVPVEVSGDGDFRSLVEAVQRRGARVTVVSTVVTRPPMIADELRRQADVFNDLKEQQSRMGRDPAERATPARIARCETGEGRGIELAR
jgi:hypothetical protein